MCICVNCHHVDDCITYHAVETQHQQPHLTDAPGFEPCQPTINVNIRNSTHKHTEVQMEWDVVGCESFVEEAGKWSRLRPGELIPT
ncbi:MAG: Ycf34 family protein [Acaryochloridaceae cyanobacterium SU_2_1]|nr:Ycf34 family protein [Acaryochloridaceae cyanobacterium SU_2_1]NJM95050.1 Ycf34 family protein [Acaryochloridaceae cyanobacterium CSU_5_19]